MIPRIPVLDAAQAAAWDRSSRDAGIPSRVLMESAGRSATQVLARAYAHRLNEGVLVAAGHGNNGGDGWVIARALRAVGVEVYAAETGKDRTPDCEANRALALGDGVRPIGADEVWSPVGIVVDALLGTGAAGAPRGPTGALAARLGSAGAPVVAVDGPTGLDLTTGETHGPVRADLTVTFGGFRRGHLVARDWCGRVVVVEMGFAAADPAWPTIVHDAWARESLPPIETSMHKGDRGRVLVVGGEDGMAGAVGHAARAAFAAGAGLVRVAAAPASVGALQEAIPDATATATALAGTPEDDLDRAVEWADAVVLGPGLGRSAERTAFVRAVLERAGETPFVLDADALHAGFDILVAGRAPRVFTPHPGEFRVAFPDVVELYGRDRFAAAYEAAAVASPHTLLLKGVPTVIATADRAPLVSASGNPSLATGGSGDVLSGLIGAFLARQVAPHDAAALGAHVLGRAAELASRLVTVRAARPGDVIDAVPELWRVLDALAPPRPPVLLELDPPAVA